MEISNTLRISRRGVALVVILLQALVPDQAVASESRLSLGCSKPCSWRSDPLMDPFYEVRYGQHMVWQVPGNPRAVLFIGHGAGRDPLSYFDPGPNCKQCFGLPEDRATVLDALRLGYAVLMVKSVGYSWRPWDVSWPPEVSADRTNVVNIIKEWTKEHSLEHLPLAVLGFSAGGNFSTVLTLDLDVQSLVLMCTPGEFPVLERADYRFPPTLFVPMPKDTDLFYPQILHAVDILRSKRVKLAQHDVWPIPVTPLFFTERIPCMGSATSERVFAAYKAENWLDENNYVTLNPRLVDWEGVLLKWKALPYCEETGDLYFALDVQQELSMAYAEHSFTSLADDVVFNWFNATLFGAPSDVLPEVMASL